MNRIWYATLLTGGLCLLLLSAALAAQWVWGVGPQLAIAVDDHAIVLDQLQDGHWATSTLLVLIVGAVLLLVVPMVLVIGLGLSLLYGALALGLGLLGAGALLLVVLSPLLLIGWLLWRALRPSQPKPATI